MTVAFDLGYEGKPCNTSLGTTEFDNLYYVKLIVRVGAAWGTVGLRRTAPRFLQNFCS
jgi:hypothetical protein